MSNSAAAVHIRGECASTQKSQPQPQPRPGQEPAPPRRSPMANGERKRFEEKRRNLEEENCTAMRSQTSTTPPPRIDRPKVSQKKKTNTQRPHLHSSDLLKTPPHKPTDQPLPAITTSPASHARTHARQFHCSHTPVSDAADRSRNPRDQAHTDTTATAPLPEHHWPFPLNTTLSAFSRSPRNLSKPRQTRLNAALAPTAAPPPASDHSQNASRLRQNTTEECSSARTHARRLSERDRSRGWEKETSPKRSGLI